MKFYKYQGTGNDFILIDNRETFFPLNNKSLVALLCNRRFGIGADGLMLLENSVFADFKMVYFNADGGESTMCGNGGRCISLFAQHLGIIQNATTTFEAIDGLHTASFLGYDVVSLKMQSVDIIQESGSDYIIDTGSPHFVRFVDDVAEADIYALGQHIRYSEMFKDGGINVNIVDNKNGHWHMRTYERGVEDETLSCGTGTVAAALCIAHKMQWTDGMHQVKLAAPGGNLLVDFEKQQNQFANVSLTAIAKKVFEGHIDLTLL